jgi:hypothetical protein
VKTQKSRRFIAERCREGKQFTYRKLPLALMLRYPVACISGCGAQEFDFARGDGTG